MAKVAVTLTFTLDAPEEQDHDEVASAFYEMLDAIFTHEPMVAFVNNDPDRLVFVTEYDPAPDGQVNL